MDTNKKVTIIIMYIICLLFSVTSTILGFSLLPKLNIYYISILIPMIVLFIVLSISLLIKLIISIIELYYGRNDNTEFIEKTEHARNVINNITKSCLLILLGMLITVTMILDILLCITKQKYILLAVSIIIWLLLIYNTIKLIIRR